MDATDYPAWIFFPRNIRPPAWVNPFVEVVREARAEVNSRSVDHLTSDKVLESLRPGLEALGYEVERGKRQAEKVVRPVLFKEQGATAVPYEVDAANDDLGIVVEIEAGRGARSNALYRDLVRASLIVDARYLVLGLMQEYRHNVGEGSTVVRSFDEGRQTLDAIFSSQRLRLPFEGVLLFGY